VVSRDPVVVVGAGAAGLFAAIHAARAGATVLALDGARTLGAKILVAGGGRCNVTHWRVEDRDYATDANPALVRRVLSRFGVDDTVAFFAEHGVELKREETGKLFPVTDKARTVLDALLGAAREAGVSLQHPCRVAAVRAEGDGFVVESEAGPIRARRVILATGGRSLPKSGSDGLGLEIARGLGHSVTGLVVPALAPLVIADGHWVRELSGIAVPAELSIVGGDGKPYRPSSGTGFVRPRTPVLCTHFGLSGPAALDISRHLAHARKRDPAARLVVNWLPDLDADRLERELLARTGQSTLAALRSVAGPEIPERFLKAAIAAAGVDASRGVQQVPKELRRALVRTLVASEIPVTGDRGFTYAETTAGGVPLGEIEIDTMASRRCPGLFLCGEILDVDGRIGGFNFQWAWASGFVAGTAAGGG
jgi:predicted Rossmann fold flavoprotein